MRHKWDLSQTPRVKGQLGEETPGWGPKMHVSRTVESNRSAQSWLSTICFGSKYPRVLQSPEARLELPAAAAPAALRPSLRKFTPQSAGLRKLGTRANLACAREAECLPLPWIWISSKACHPEVPVELLEASRVTPCAPRPPILPKGASIMGGEMEE